MFAHLRRPSAAFRLSAPLVTTALFLAASPAAAQVSGTVVIGSGPVRGAVVVGRPLPPPRPVVVYQPVRGRRVMVARYVPQVVYVESRHGRHGKPASWYRRHGYVPVTLYFADGRYYSQAYAARTYRYGPAFTPVIVWARGNRYYLPADGWPGEYGFVSSYDGVPYPELEYAYDRPAHHDDDDWDD